MSYTTVQRHLESLKDEIERLVKQADSISKTRLCDLDDEIDDLKRYARDAADALSDLSSEIDDLPSSQDEE